MPKPNQHAAYCICHVGRRSRYGLALQASWLFEMDSCTPEKFSRHLIIRIPGRAWPSNGVVGAFVNNLTGAPGFEGLMVERPGGGARTCLVDLGVYTRNRHFRLLGSSKGGKSFTLQPLARASDAGGLRPAQRLLLSLICNVHPDAQLLDQGLLAMWARSGAAPRATGRGGDRVAGEPGVPC